MTTSAEVQPLTLKLLKDALEGDAAAFRCRARLSPAGGDGDKVFPPTYAGAVYAREDRRVHMPDGSIVTLPCVLLDSVQSQANRLEEALQRAVDSGRLNKAGCSLPVIQVDFSGEALLDAVGTISSLQAPHRAADAILRDSLIADGDEKGTAFRKSKLGALLDHASLQNATPLYQICPTALIFGIWDSTGPKGGLGAKFQRAVVSEIVGINAVFGVKTSSRIDPLQIRAAAKVVKSADGYALAVDDKQKGAVSPSEVNHGNIPPDVTDVNKGEAGGVTIDYAELTTVVSLPAIRRLRFPLGNQAAGHEVNVAAQVVLTALSLLASALASESGYDLRSRCLLWPDDPLLWELLDKPGAVPKRISVTVADALPVFDAALQEAERLGLAWRKEALKLQPAPQLVALLKKSQQIAAADDAED